MKLCNEFYVNNCVISLPNEEALSTFIQEAKEIMAQASFDLRGWAYTEYPDKDNSYTITWIKLEQGFRCVYHQS